MDAKQAIDREVFVDERPMNAVPGRRNFKFFPLGLRGGKKCRGDLLQGKPVLGAIDMQNQEVALEGYFFDLMKLSHLPASL
jgi:hypothetical protein